MLQGMNYDPPNLSFYVSKLTMFVKLALIMAILSAYDVWGLIGRPTPGWYTWCQENKMYAGMMIFFVGNMLEGQVNTIKNLLIYFKYKFIKNPYCIFICSSSLPELLRSR